MTEPNTQEDPLDQVLNSKLAEVSEITEADVAEVIPMPATLAPPPTPHSHSASSARGPQSATTGEVSPADMDFILRVFAQVKAVDFRSSLPPPSLQSNAAGLDKKMEMLRQRVRELERDLARVGFIWSVKQREIDASEHTVRAKEAERAAAVEGLTVVQQRAAAELAAQAERERQDKAHLLAEYTSKIEQAQAVFNELRETSARVIAESEARLHEREREIAELNQLVATRDAALSAAHDETAGVRAELESKIGELRQARDELEQTLATREATLTETRGQLELANRQLGEAAAHVETLTAERQQETTQLEERLVATRLELEGELLRTRTESDTALGRVRAETDAELARARADADGELLRLRNETDAELLRVRTTAETELGARHAELQAARDELTAALGDAARATTLLAEREAALSSLNDELGRAKVERDELLARHDATVTSHAAQLTALEERNTAALGALQAELTRARGELESAESKGRNDREEATRLIAARDAALDEANRALTQTRAERSELEAGLRQHHEQIEGLSLHVATIEGELAGRDATLSTARIELESSRRALAEATAASEQAAQTHRARAAELEAARAAVQDELGRLRVELEGQVARLTSALDEVSAVLREREAELRRVTQELATLGTRAGELEHELAEQQTLVAQKDSEIAAHVDELRILRADYEQVSKRLQEVEGRS